MGMKASEVDGWLRQMAGKRDHREALRDDYRVLQPGPNFDWFMAGGRAVTTTNATHTSDMNPKPTTSNMSMLLPEERASPLRGMESA